MQVREALCAVVAAGFLAAGSASAQDWPVKPVRFVVAGAAGSAPDIVVRLVGERLSKIWGQQTVVDNRPGAAGNTGTNAAARAAPDGYTFLFGQAAPLALNRHTFKSLPFDTLVDFVPVVNAGLSSMMIAVNADLPAKSLAELIAMARAQPGKINFGTSSSRNIPHLTGEIMASRAGVRLVHVPYQTNTQAATEAISGLTQIYIDGVPPVIPHVKSGRLRALAVTSARRLPDFPDIPAVAETLPGFEFGGWFAIFAPAGTPPAIVARLNRDANVVFKAPDLLARLATLGIYEPGGTSAELAAFLKSEIESYGRAVKAAKIEPE